MAAHLTLPARHDKMVELVETMRKLHGDSSRRTADSLRHEEKMRGKRIVEDADG